MPSTCVAGKVVVCGGAAASAAAFFSPSFILSPSPPFGQQSSE
jgi:hypothetical protein